MALRTFAAVSGATRGWLLMTRETVELETPASFATRVMDMGALRWLRPWNYSNLLEDYPAAADLRQRNLHKFPRLDKCPWRTCRTGNPYGTSGGGGSYRTDVDQAAVPER